MTRKSFRFREQTLTPDESVEPARYVLECVACGFFGPKSEDVQEGAEWAAGHLTGHPDHRAYREHITRAYVDHRELHQTGANSQVARSRDGELALRGAYALTV